MKTDNFELVAVFLASAAADASRGDDTDRGWLGADKDRSVVFLGIVMLNGTPPPPVSAPASLIGEAPNPGHW